MFLAGLLLFNRVGDKPPARQSVSPLAERHEDGLIAVKDIVVVPGLAQQTTVPALLLAKAAVAQHRFRVVLEHSRYFQSLGSAGWTASKQLLLADIKDVTKGQEVRLPIVSCSPDAGDLWLGR